MPNSPEPYERPEHDWRDPSQPWNPEDDGIIHGWRRCADGTWERVDSTEYDPDLAAEDLYPDIEAEEPTT